MADKLELNEIVLIGRTYDEYRKMFSLDDELLKGEPVLDVASGVSSFCAEASAKGFNVVATDRIYNFDANEIEAKCRDDLELIVEQLPDVAHLYNWSYFKDIAVFKENRGSGRRYPAND